MRFKRPLPPIAKKARRGDRGYPLATVAYYGPDNTRASKVAVGIIPVEGGQPAKLERFYLEKGDARYDPAIQKAIQALLGVWGVKSVASLGTILGCPHEEGIEYPEGEECRHCPYWKGRDRYEDAFRAERARQLAEWLRNTPPEEL